MKKIFIVCLILIQLSCGTSQRPVNPWLNKIKQVHVGMSREDIEIILPPCYLSYREISSCGCHGVGYHIDENWYVELDYLAIEYWDPEKNTKDKYELTSPVRCKYKPLTKKEQEILRKWWKKILKPMKTGNENEKP